MFNSVLEHFRQTSNERCEQISIQISFVKILVLFVEVITVGVGVTFLTSLAAKQVYRSYRTRQNDAKRRRKQANKESSVDKMREKFRNNNEKVITIYIMLLSKSSVIKAEQNILNTVGHPK